MANDDSLFTRRTEQEIDEALEWLENVGGDTGSADKKLPSSKKNAFEVLPTWLKMDLHLEAKPDPPVDAPRIQNDNLSWLDSIASGLGGPIEEPPTMSWEETAILQVTDEERARALSDAASVAQNRLEGDSIEEAVTGAAIEAARQLETPEADEKTQIGVRPVEHLPPEAAAFPLSDDELTAIYEQVERDFSQSDYELEDSLMLTPLEGTEESLPEDALPELSKTELVPPVDFEELPTGLNADPTEIILDDAEPAQKLVPEGVEEIREVRETIDDQLLHATDAADSAEVGQEPTQIVPAEELEAPRADAHSAIGSQEPTQIYLPDEEPVDTSQVDPTQIYMPKAAALADDEPSQMPTDIEASVTELTELYLPDSAELPASESDLTQIDHQEQAVTDLAVEMPEASADSEILDSVSDLTEIYLPDAEAQPESTEKEDRANWLSNAFAESLDQAKPSADPPSDLTELYMPEDGAVDAAEAFVTDNSQEAVTQIYAPKELPAEAFTEIYLPQDAPNMEAHDEDAILSFAKAADRDIPLIENANVENTPLTDLFIPEFDEAAANESAIEAPLESEGLVQKEAEISVEPTVVSIIPISDRYEALADGEEDVSELASQDFAELARDMATESPVTVSEEALAESTALPVDDSAGSIADAIPEDPDEAMAWLEKMAQGYKPENLTSGLADADITETLAASPEEVKAGMAELIRSSNEPTELMDQQPDVADVLEAIESEATAESLAETQISDAATIDLVQDPAALGLQPRQQADDELDAIELPTSAEITSTPSTPSSKSEPLSDELNDALAWLEDVASSSNSSVDEVTVELDQDDVQRLLDEHLAHKSEVTEVTTVPDVSSTVAESQFEDQPTLITEMPDISAALASDEPTQIDSIDKTNELDEALAWLEAFASEDDATPRPGAMAAQALQQSVVDDTVAPIFESERLAAHKSFEQGDVSAIYRNYSGILAKKDELGADLVARDVADWVKQQPEQPQLFQLLGEANLQLGRFEQSARAFKRALALR